MGQREYHESPILEKLEKSEFLKEDTPVSLKAVL
jgi:hypothetical protein